MARSDGYNTKTRQLILDYLINNRQHAVSASNILAHLEEPGRRPPTPPRSTAIWINWPGEQRVMKYVADKGEKAVFQYVDEGRHCREHLHLKCVRCGRIYHLDCHFMDEVRAPPDGGARLYPAVRGQRFVRFVPPAAPQRKPKPFTLHKPQKNCEYRD